MKKTKLDVHGAGSLDRRDFLKASALAGAAAGLMGLTGCAPQSNPEKEPTPQTGEEAASPTQADETVECDFLVIGGGIGGFSAALTAHEEGIERVVLLEKYGTFGGTTLFAEGIFANNSRAQQELGYAPVAVKDILDMELEFHHRIINPQLFRSFLEASSDNVDWLMDQGITFEKLDVPVLGTNCLHIYEGGNGTSAIEILSKKAIEEYGIDARTDTQATELILEDGAVIGARAQSKGRTVDFMAPYVLVATGGMAANPQMMDEYTKLDTDKYAYCGGNGADGDGHRLCEATAMGRAKNVCAMNMWLHVAGASVKTTENYVGGMEASNIWINENGVRFVGEDVTNDPGRLIDTNNVVHSQGRVYSIFDTAHIDSWAKNGTVTSFSGFCPVGKPIDGIPEALDSAVANDMIDYFRADSIEDLARQIDVDPAALRQTIDTWNGYVEAGKDEEFGKDPAVMFPITEPPFYAARLINGVLTTVGGIRIDTKGRVCAADGTPVPGLHAAGVACSGFSSETYSMHAPGTAQGSGVYLGRMAARAAAGKE